MTTPSQTPKRHAHLVGSLPYQSERQAMTSALTQLSPHLLSLPDGEVGTISSEFPNGDRSAWTAIITERCSRDKRTWKVTRMVQRNEVGFQRDYKTGARLKPIVRKEDLAAKLNFGWSSFAKESFGIFKEVRRGGGGRKSRSGGWEGVMFQVGLPTAMGMTFSMCAPLDAIKYAGAFTERMAVEANEIIEMVANDEEYDGKVLLQLEVPGELAMAYMLPGFAIGVALRSVVDLINRIKDPKGVAVFGVHLCYGDLNNRALILKPKLNKSVKFVNALMEKWPQDKKLNYVHIPLAVANKPPSLSESWYKPLKDLKLPQGVRLIAGFVHEKRSMSQHKKILGMVEGIAGGPVDIACTCGLGRRPRHVAESLLETTKELVES